MQSFYYLIPVIVWFTNRRSTYSILIEEIQHHAWQSVIAPVTVNQKEPLQIFEPWKSKIWCHHSLSPFMTRNSNSNICCLNHWHIICTITCRLDIAVTNLTTNHNDHIITAHVCNILCYCIPCMMCVKYMSIGMGQVIPSIFIQGSKKFTKILLNKALRVSRITQAHITLVCLGHLHPFFHTRLN